MAAVMRRLWASVLMVGCTSSGPPAASETTAAKTAPSTEDACTATLPADFIGTAVQANTSTGLSAQTLLGLQSWNWNEHHWSHDFYLPLFDSGGVVMQSPQIEAWAVLTFEVDGTISAEGEGEVDHPGPLLSLTASGTWQEDGRRCLQATATGSLSSGEDITIDFIVQLPGEAK